MTSDTPTPAQQLEEVLDEMELAANNMDSMCIDLYGKVCEYGYNMRKARAAVSELIKAVEGATYGTAGYYSRPPLRTVTGIAIECAAEDIERLVHKRVLIIPADAVEVKS